MEIFNNILELRKFDDDCNDNQIVIDIALPVSVFECSASERADSDIDELAKTILKFIKYGVYSDAEIGGLLSISSDVIRHVKVNKLQSFLDDDGKINELGEKCLAGELDNLYKCERTFGNMFSSIVDGEVMPYFYKGKLPVAGQLHYYKDIYVVCPNNSITDSDMLYDVNFTNAYKKSVKISQYMDASSTPEITESVKSEFDLLTTDFDDVIYTNIEDEDPVEEVVTLADKEAKEKQTREYVKVFGATKVNEYVLTKLIIDKSNPFEYIMLSPFEGNVTTWYTKRIPFMEYEANNINIYKYSEGYDSAISVKEFLSNLTDNVFNDYPELSSLDFKWFQKANFPLLGRLTENKESITKALSSYYNSVSLNDSGRNTPNEVITTMGLTLETILNCYIKRINIRRIVDNSLIIPYNRNYYDSIFDKYGIPNCIARTVAQNCAGKMQQYKSRAFMNSISLKYCLLILYGYCLGKKASIFMNILDREGPEFIERLDFIIKNRNEYTSHNDSDIVRDIPEEDFVKLKKDFVYVVQHLIEELYSAQEVNK